MAGFVNPMDLIAPYLTPLTANVNQGIGTGLNLLNMKTEMAKLPYYSARSDLYKQQIAASKAQELERIAQTKKLTDEETRQKKAADYFNNFYTPSKIDVFGNAYNPGEIPLTSADPLQINPLVNLGGLSQREADAARIAATPTGTKTVNPIPTMGQKRANPFLSLDDQLALEKQEQTEAYQNEMNRLRDEQRTSLERIAADRVAANERIAADREAANERIAADREAAKLAVPAKITAKIALNPISEQNEYLLTDGSFSGRVAGHKPKAATGADIKRLSDMVKAIEGEPTATDIALINEAADAVGYEYVRAKGKTAVRGIPGVSWFDFGGNETNAWVLKPKATVQSGGKPIPKTNEYNQAVEAFGTAKRPETKQAIRDAYKKNTGKDLGL